MRHFGLYEPVVQRALEDVGAPPWSIEDLNASESRISNEYCRHVYPPCLRKDVIHWLHTLSPADRQELVEHLNAEKAGGREPRPGGPARHFGYYEPAVRQALEEGASPPWSLADLEECETRIAEKHCRRVYPDCRPADVIAWLRTLSTEDRQELVDHLNREKAARHTG